MPIQTGKTYAEIIRAKLRDAKNRKSMREVGRNIDFSYEHVRKAVSGEVTFTKQFSDALCAELGLPADEMWTLAQSQKLRKRFEGADFPADLPRRDDRVKEIWGELDSFGREAWIRAGRDLIAVADRAQRRQKVCA